MESRTRRLIKKDGWMNGSYREDGDKRKRGIRQRGRCGGDVSGRCDRRAYGTSNLGRCKLIVPSFLPFLRLFLVLFCRFVLLQSLTGISRSSNNNWAVTRPQTKPGTSKSKLSNPPKRIRMQSLLIQRLAGKAKSS